MYQGRCQQQARRFGTDMTGSLTTAYPSPPSTEMCPPRSPNPSSASSNSTVDRIYFSSRPQSATLPAVAFADPHHRYLTQGNSFGPTQLFSDPNLDIPPNPDYNDFQAHRSAISSINPRDIFTTSTSLPHDLEIQRNSIFARDFQDNASYYDCVQDLLIRDNESIWVSSADSGTRMAQPRPVHPPIAFAPAQDVDRDIDIKPQMRYTPKSPKDTKASQAGSHSSSLASNDAHDFSSEHTGSENGAHIHRSRRIDSQDSPYVCEQCNRAFRRKYNLSSHLKTHDPQQSRDWPCNVNRCGMSFRRFTDLKRHNDSVSHAGA